jgi:hypothetical protein
MAKPVHIENLKQEIDNGCDAKLESQLLLALEAGLSANDFFIAPNGLFYRPYSKDVLHAEITEDARRKNILQLNITRSGIYDQLPEGLFFQPAGERSFMRNATDMAEDYKRNKKNEQAIRRFFMPIENDFFWQRIQLEKEECGLLEGLQSGILNDYFTKFWEIDPAIPKFLVIQLVLLLPYAHRITGDLEITAKCLQKLLNEEVRITEKLSPRTNADQDSELDNFQLGINSMCGNNFYEPYAVLECSIGPLQTSSVIAYIEGGERDAFLKTFYHFFIPAEAEVITNIEVANEKKQMHLKTADTEEPVLGYSSFL